MWLSLAAIALSVANVNAQDSSALAKSIDLGKQVQKSILKLPLRSSVDLFCVSSINNAL